MRREHGFWLLALVIPLALAGCGEAPSQKAKPQAAATTSAPTPAPKAEASSDEAEIRANLAKLSPEDRRLAEQQKYCAVETEDRLGEMGPPVKILVKGQPVFLCCGHCQKKALADPDKTLARVEELKKRSGAAPAR